MTGAAGRKKGSRLSCSPACTVGRMWEGMSNGVEGGGGEALRQGAADLGDWACGTHEVLVNRD